MELYGFWRSAATFRVRVALNLKGIQVREIPIDLDGGEQNAAAFRAINPQGAVPALVRPGQPILTQSLAILEYLEEVHPEPPILPKDAEGRARVRSLAFLIACDSHPLIVPRVKGFMTGTLGLSAEQWRLWLQQWFGAGLHSLEARLAAEPETGRFCHGDSPSLADLCLVSCVLGVRVFNLDIPDIPTVTLIADTCLALPAFAAAHPSRQQGSPGAA